jgi:hypothetical protein
MTSRLGTGKSLTFFAQCAKRFLWTLQILQSARKNLHSGRSMVHSAVLLVTLHCSKASKRGPRSFLPRPFGPKRNTYAPKASQMVLKWESFPDESSNTWGEDSMIQKHMHRTFMSTVSKSCLICACMPWNYFSETWRDDGRRAAWVSFTVNTLRFSRRFQTRRLENCGI